jgi:hypothetical protein
MGISGRTKGKAPLSLGESLTPKGRDGLTEAFVDWKPMRIFGCNETDGEMI